MHQLLCSGDPLPNPFRMKRKDLKLKRKSDVDDKKGKLPFAKKPRKSLQEPSEPTTSTATKTFLDKSFPPLPKTQIVPIDAVESTHQSGKLALPPPDMEYLTKKRAIPLEWTPPHQCTGFVLEDNSVVYIGTKHCEEALRRSFINVLLGRDEDDNGDSTDLSSMETEPASVKSAPDAVTLSSRKNVLKESTDNTPCGLDSASGGSHQHDKIPTTASASENNRRLARASAPTDGKSATSSSVAGGSLDQTTEPQAAEVYDTGWDDGILQDPQVLKEFIGDDSNTGSEDSDVCGINSKYSVVSHSKAQASKHVFKNVPRAGADERPSEQPYSSDFSHGGTAESRGEVSALGWNPTEQSFCEGHRETDQRSEEHFLASTDGGGEASWIGEAEPVTTVTNCPICAASFPPGYSQISADEHIAMCYAVNFDDQN